MSNYNLLEESKDSNGSRNQAGNQIVNIDEVRIMILLN